MRLTLRTLLAYLDDRLPSGNARELGQKIAKSPFATELADRIKSVVRRRRLASEPATQKSIDANLIAEYLDDQLTPELVALIEKEILASDATLAEVAATHQILGLLSDPVELSPALTERLYKLAPEAANDNESASDPSNAAGANWKPLAPQSAAQRQSPMIILAVMVLGWLGLLATDSHLFKNRDSDDTNVAQFENRPGGAAPVDLGAAGSKETTSEPTANVVDQTKPSAQEKAPTTDSESPENLPQGKGETRITANNSDSPQEPVPSTNSPPESMRPSIADDATALKPKTNKQPGNDTAPTVVPPPVKTLTLSLDDQYSMLVLGDPTAGTWNWADTAGADRKLSDRLMTSVVAIAEPFHARLTAGKAGWSLLLVGSTLVKSAKNVSDGLEILDGRVLIERVPGNDSDSTFSLLVGGTAVSIAVPDLKKRVGIEVQPQIALGGPDEGDALNPLKLLPNGQPCTVTVFAADSAISLSLPGSQKPTIIPQGSQLTWNTDSTEAPVPSTVTAIPGWVFEVTEPKPESTEKQLLLTATELRKAASFEDAASELLEHRNPQVAAHAVNLPAVTRAVDQLCGILLNSDESSVRTQGIGALQRIVLRSPGGRSAVAEVLQTRLPETELDNVMKLLEGITETAAEDRFVSSWLLGMLEANRLAVRELAIYNLEQLVGERNAYFADDDSGRRDSAIRRWKRLVDRNDGRLIIPKN